MHFRPLQALKAGSVSLRPRTHMWGESKSVAGVPEQYLHQCELSKILESPDSHNKNVYIAPNHSIQAGGDF